MQSTQHIVEAIQRLWTFIISFHVECNLPDISACQICKNFLASKVSSLGLTANTTVHHFDPDNVEASGENELSDEDEEDDIDSSSASILSGEDDDEQLDERSNTQTVLQLIDKVNAWRRCEGPHL